MKYRGHLDTWQNLRQEVELKVSEYFSGLTTAFVNVTNAKTPTAINAVNINNSRLKTPNTRLRSRMTKIERFEDIEAWKAARELTQNIYKATKHSDFSQDFGLRNQIQRASVSIMANTAEGFDSHSDEEFVRFLRYGLRSATEVQSHLYVALDQNYISKEKFTDLYDQANTVKKLISGLIRYLRN